MPYAVRLLPLPAHLPARGLLMPGGLAALLDDIAALAKIAAASIDDVAAASAKASAKAAGVVVDDTAVTPRYVHGFTADRELPIIKRIALGSLRNKLLFIVPAALALSQWLPWALTPLLMLGGTYLCFEGAEKLLEMVSPADEVEDDVPAAMLGEDHEKTMVAGAIRTDFILSAEIIVIALNEVASSSFWLRAFSLVVVSFAITALVYGVVALIVKMDDVGLALAERPSPGAQRFGRALVAGMPRVLSVLSVVGVVAMLWVGGHILLVGADNLGWHGPYGLVHHAEAAVAGIAGVGGFLAWLVNTLLSALVGVLVGGIVVGVLHLLPHKKAHGASPAGGH